MILVDFEMIEVSFQFASELELEPAGEPGARSRPLTMTQIGPGRLAGPAWAGRL